MQKQQQQMLFLSLMALAGAVDTGKLILDMMQMNFTNTNYSDATWTSIVQCMYNMSSITVPVHDVDNASWNSMLQYAFENGTVGDPWGKRGLWLEWNPQPMCAGSSCYIANASSVIIGEPCDYVSNVAYYISMVSLCTNQTTQIAATASKAIVQSFDMLSVGSSFFHASATNVGALLDMTPIALIALVAYQAAVSELPPLDSDVLHDLRNDSLYNLTVSGTNAVKLMGETLLHVPVQNWTDAINLLRTQYQSNYYLTFGATVILILRLTLPDVLVVQLIPVLGKVLAVSQEDVDWLTYVYDPTLTTAFQQSNVRVPFESRVEIAKRGIGVLVKMVYAFLWQEQTIVGPWLVSPLDNLLGAFLMPLVNRMGDFLTGYPHPSYVTDCGAVYPGSTMCRARIAHAKWHEESANGLVDLIYLTDDVRSILLSSSNISVTANYQPTHDQLAKPTEAGCFDVFNNAVLLTSWMCEEPSWKCALEAAFGREEASMDVCLFKNHCVGPNGTMIKSCAHGVCAPYVQKSAYLDTCLTKCSDVYCAILCARQFTQFSPLGAALIDCIPHIGSEEGPADQCATYSSRLEFAGFSNLREVYVFAQCVAAKMPASSPFWSAVGESAQCAIHVLGT